MSCSPVAVFEQAVSTPLQRCPSIHLLIPIEEHPLRLGSFVQGDHVPGVPLYCLLCSSTRDIYQAPGESGIGLELCKQPLFLFLQWWRRWDLERSSSLPKAFTAPVRCYSSKKDMSVLQGWRNSDKDWKCPLSSEWQRHSWSHIDRNTGTWKPREIWVGASRYPLPPWPSWWGSNVGCSCGKVRILQIRKFWTEGVCPQFACYPYSSLSLPNAPILSIDAPLTQDHPSHMEDLSKLTTGCSLVDP